MDFKIKAIKFNRDSFTSERKLSKEDWVKIKSVFDSLNFWCINPDFNKGTIDGPEVKIIGIKDSSTFYTVLTKDYEKDSVLQSNKTKLKIMCLNFLNIGGLQHPQKPKIAHYKLDNKKIGIEIYSLNYNFSKLFEVYLDDKKVEIKQGVAELIILESDLGKLELKVKEVLINDVELTFKATLNQYLLDVNKINK